LFFCLFYVLSVRLENPVFEFINENFYRIS